MKNISLFKIAGLLTVLISACTHKLNNNGCPPQMCTMEFATIGVKITDKAGNPVNAKEIRIINTRTNKQVVPHGLNGAETPVGSYVIATDSNKKEFSTNGDDVLVTAIAADGKKATATLKIIGTCNCHVKKISGLETIVFE